MKNRVKSTRSFLAWDSPRFSTPHFKRGDAPGQFDFMTIFNLVMALVCGGLGVGEARRGRSLQLLTEKCSKQHHPRPSKYLLDVQSSF